MFKSTHQLRAGDVVLAHGGKFKVLHDAMESQAHRLQHWTPADSFFTLPGPCDCAYARAVCLEGEIPGYFRPGTEWTFQGNFKAGRLTVEPAPSV